MKAAVYYETGSPSVLRYEDVTDPVPGSGEILIEVEAISIEGGDTLNRLGGEMARVPHIVGYQAAGTVTGCGEGVTRFVVGDQVVGIGVDGSHVEQRVVGEGFAWRVPDRLAITEAAAVPIAFGTAWGLPVRVRATPGGRDRADPRRCRGRRSRSHTDGEAGRRSCSRHRLERRSPRPAGGSSASTRASTTRRTISSSRRAA